MSLHEIENLTHAELKAQRDELVKAAAHEHVADLAARYVQARTDAKARDEKLAEQGATITALTAGNAAMQQKIADLDTRLVDVGNELLCCAENHNRQASVWAEQRVGLDAEIAELQEKLASETARANRLKAEAARNFAALSTAEKAVKDAMAARELEAVEKGE